MKQRKQKRPDLKTEDLDTQIYVCRSRQTGLAAGQPWSHVPTVNFPKGIVDCGAQWDAPRIPHVETSIILRIWRQEDQYYYSSQHGTIFQIKCFVKSQSSIMQYLAPAFAFIRQKQNQVLSLLYILSVHFNSSEHHYTALLVFLYTGKIIVILRV